MATLDMTKITEYLERSMRNCSLSNERTRVGDGTERSSREEEEEIDDDISMIGDKTLELNSHISIPPHLKQCLDLKTGEIYYVNWNNGMRMNEDPRRLGNNADEFSDASYGSVFSEEDNSYYETEESSSESSPSSREKRKEEDEEDDEEEEEVVLVVAGCKACFMYFMVPKLLEDCPKCSAQLLHFGPPRSA